MITKASIDTVLETARVEEVIGDFVQLKRAGSNFKGLSPFSPERTPSFMVSPVKQIWKDFSSGKGGNVLSFIMEHEHFTYPEAIRFLAKKYGIELEETEQSDEEKAIADVRESMYLVSEFAKDYFHKTLLDTEEGKAIGLTYFKERGFTADTIKKFSLGYSPDHWDSFTKEAQSKGYKLEYLISTGLTIASENNPFDRFKGRVMFPIQSMSGRILGFGGRILTNDKKAAKYLNSPESELYHKSKVLYGIYQAKQAIAKQNNCYLVEGYTDVIQFNQSGIENVVASSGTALTHDQIRLINRLTKNITVLFDGDAAGLRASIRGIDLILEEGMNVKVCTFPDGEDPDSFAKKTPTDELVSYLETNSKDFIRFKASLLMDDASNDPVKKADLIRDMVMSISKIPDRIQREVYIKECSRIMDISEQVLTSTLAQMLKKEVDENYKQQRKEQTPLEVVNSNEQDMSDKVDRLYALERKIIEILLLYGNKTEEFEDIYLNANEEGEVEYVSQKKEYKVYQRVYLSLQEDEVEFANDLFKNLYTDIMDRYLQEDLLDMEKYLAQLKPEFTSEVTDILMEDEQLPLHNWADKHNIVTRTKEDSVAQYVTETIISLRWYLVDKIVDDLKKTITKDYTIDNTEVLTAIMDYKKLIGFFSEKFGRLVTKNPNF